MLGIPASWPVTTVGKLVSGRRPSLSLFRLLFTEHFLSSRHYYHYFLMFYFIFASCELEVLLDPFYR